jgi:hypothetical protein
MGLHRADPCPLQGRRRRGIFAPTGLKNLPIDASVLDRSTEARYPIVRPTPETYQET